MKGYVGADTSVIIHENDPDLTPIRLSLPSPPDLELIDGYGLPIQEQRFHRLEIPVKLRRLEKLALSKLEARRAKNKNFVITLYKLQSVYWDILENKRGLYAEEIQFIRKLWWHRLYGYWFYNRGKPTYITGWHFMYLNFWHMPDVKGGYPEYRDRDRKEFLFHQYCYTTTETFEQLSEDGLAIKGENGYVMKDMGRRTCYGPGQSKNRRSGNTNKGLNNVMCITTTTLGTDGGGVMSYTGNNAESHFRQKLVIAWNRYPLFFKPLCTSGSNPTSLDFNVVDSEFRLHGLQTGITYASTSNAKFYDGKKLVGVLMDEEGKCLGINTLVRMYDGSVKPIQDVVVGDQLMGDDSTPRNVIKLSRGRDDMYRVVPKKGKVWECNSEHILSVKASYSGLMQGVQKNDTIDIPLYWYHHLKGYIKRGLMLYRVGVEYKERKHDLRPYMLGLWLGDGNSVEPSITACDSEVIDYLHDYASEKGLGVRLKADGISYHLTCGKAGGKNSLLSALKDLSLIKNKHIPDEYIVDNIDNRLQLLAGIIDSDGSRGPKNKRVYDIVQKNKRLAYDIMELAKSVGFHSVIENKVARMKRDDGSVYECDVYRVKIYGNDLGRIPCKVKRKQYNVCEFIHANTRNPMRSGFSVEYKGIGDYYGVIIDGNRRFLLDDYTVVHNTTEVDVDERWRTIVNCLSQGNGAIIHGYAYHPSTVEDYTSGGAAYRRLMEKSSFYQRVSVSGQTPSGLFRLFIPADEGLDGFIDSFGYSVKGVLKNYQKEEGFTQTATEFLQGIRNYYSAIGTPEAQADYRTQQKLFPLQYSDSWLGEAGDIGFDLEIIDKRIAELHREKKTVTGNFDWEGDIFGAPVKWTASDNGRFEVSRLFEKRANQRIPDSYFDFIDQEEKETWRPRDPTFATAGSDPFQFKTSSEMKVMPTYVKHGMSDGGFLVLWEYDEHLDRGKKRSEWESERVICTYRFRPRTDDEYCEDVLKACIWYGCMVYPEMNLSTVYKKFREWGYAGYLKHDVSADGVMKNEPGFHMTSSSKQEGFNYARDFISMRGHTIDHLDLLMECKNITKIEELTNYDLLASFLGALIGSRSRYSKIIKQSSETEVNIAGILKQFKY
jgi:hypothetical protein